MKKIIKGKQYDTDKARFIGCDEGGERGLAHAVLPLGLISAVPVV
jgi:hypothetical protein